MTTPDTTTAQILALIGAVVGLLVAYGLIDNDHAQAIVAQASIIVPSVWILADSIIRHGRSKVLAAPPQIIVADPKTSLLAIEGAQGRHEADEPQE